MSKPDPKAVSTARATALDMALSGNVEGALDVTAILNMVTETPVAEPPKTD